MKIQCSCGAKYEFDITPMMVKNPVRFVCKVCGADASEFVDGLVRQELGQSATPSGVPQQVTAVPTLPPGRQAAPPAPAPAAPAPVPPAPAPVTPPAAAPAPVRLAIARPPVAAAPVVPADAPQAEFPRCSRHPGQIAAERCVVCSKPICPKCMELFGYVCSPLCRGRAESQGIEVPVFAGQKSVRERREGRKVGLIGGGIAALVLLLVGTWCWYEWYGGRPHPIFSVRFPEAAYSGESFVSGKDQIVFLHGGTLAHYDLKRGKAVWSRELLDAKELDAEAEKTLKEMEEDYARGSAGSFKLRPPPLPKLREQVERNAAAALQLFVHDHYIWVASPGKLDSPGKLVRYNWETGSPEKEVPLQKGLSRLMVQGDELLACYSWSDSPILAHINMNTCEVQNENPGHPPPALLAKGGTNGTGGGTEMAGLPMAPGQDAGKPLDPAKVAEQAQRLSYPARVALPATLAATANQERALAEMKSDEESVPASKPGARKPAEPDHARLVAGPDGFVQFSTRLLESRLTQRTAMKAAPKKSALDNLSVANTADAANEILNEMQRNRGGDVVTEDESRYLVTIRRPGETESWSGEVVGPPSLYPLKTVDVLAANKSIIVLDKNHKKLWQSSLSFNVPGWSSEWPGDDASRAQGPCVERGSMLFVFDQGVLTAFDLATGNVLWRLPSVGITGLFFDDEGKLYVNSSSASLDNIKYSRQIDITQKTKAVVMKVEPKDGKVLWTAEPGGMIDYLSGKFIYTVSANQAPESDDENPYSVGMASVSFLRIRRISPKNGHIIWEHGQDRCPLDIQFDKNTIRLVFKKEVEVLRFLAF